jgi:hypothetical protein
MSTATDEVAQVAAGFRSQVADAVSAAAAASARGALPLELRSVLEAIRGYTARLLAALSQRLPDGNPEVDRLRTELDSFVDQVMRDFTAKVRPAPTVAGIFANAQRTTTRFAEVRDGVRTKKCPLCGAARPEGTDLRACAFCGQSLFPGADG